MDGGCACGASRYRLGRRPMFVHACHCRLCQTTTGSAFVIHAVIEAEMAALVSGELTAFARAGGSGHDHLAWCCARCGVQLWTTYPGFGEHMRFLRVGTLDDPGALPPQAHIFTRSKLDWVDLPADVPAFETYYAADQLWSPEARDRRAAVLDRKRAADEALSGTGRRDMKRRVSVEDRVRIEELMARYAWALDTGDLDGYVACFTEDGWVEHPPEGRCVGREGLRRLTESLWYGEPNRYLGRQHRMSQILMTPEDDDVRIKCFWSILQQDVETLNSFVFALGTWDTLVTRAGDGDWLFRSIHVDLWRRNGVPWVGERRAARADVALAGD